MKKIKIILVAAAFAGSVLLSACHTSEPPCPAYVDIHQSTQ